MSFAHQSRPAVAGVTVHGLLTGLDADDHSIYALLAGRSGGQTFVGGAAASEHLTLQSTAHATRGYVRAQDDLQLLSNILRDSGGNARVTLATASPHLLATGDLHASGHLAAGSLAPPVSRVGTFYEILSTQPAQGLMASVLGNAATGAQVIIGCVGAATSQGTPTYSMLYGLYYQANHATASANSGGLTAMLLQLLSSLAGTGAITAAKGIDITPANWAGAKPSTVTGIHVQQQGHAAVATAYGLQVADQSATTVRLQELGPAVPYLRLGGGANPAANTSHLSLKFGATLKLLTEGAVDSGGAGFRQVLVPN